MAERTSLAAGIMMAALGIVLLPKLAESRHWLSLRLTSGMGMT